MTYDPFARGPFPVGVRTFTLRDRTRDDRTLAVEVWYPATDAHAGADLDGRQDAYEMLPGLPPVTQEAVRDAAPRSGVHPLVLFSHGFGGHRRQSTFLCTHVASHGYVVAACDHTGNTVFDVMQATLTARTGGALPDFGDTLRTFAVARPADVRVLLDQLLDGLSGDLGTLIDRERIGMSGHSFGGWTTLVVTARDRRIRAALPLAPAGGATPIPVPALHEALDFGWGREVPTLFLVAERDSLLPLGGMHDLFDRTPSRWKKLVVMNNTDHMHFCDRIEQVHEIFRLMPPPGAFEEVAHRVPPIDQLAPPDHAYRWVRGLGLAHWDATLKENEAARQLLDGDVRRTLSERGIDVTVFEPR